MEVFDSVDEWLQSIDSTSSTSLEGKEEKGCKYLWYHLACPTRIAKHKDGVCEASSFDHLDDDLYKKTVKPAHSSFGVVSYDETTDSTLLICRPYTGRTHQLRLHLQYLQHSIANDPNYGGDIWYGNSDGRQACKIAQDRLNVLKNSEGEDDPSTTETTNSMDKKRKRCLTIDTSSETSEPTTRTSAIDVPATESEVQDRIATAVRQNEESIHSFIERTCVWCARSRSVPSEDRAVLEFVIRSPGIWLHALRYSFTMNTTASNGGDDSEGEGRAIAESFRTKLPDWHDMRKN
uniref:Pseudouridine synthase RsuA/RluA-like domain-containing protein n=1 Tax=Pseudo-nitzschia australis TaxID=44445 RepID=A0A7S4EN90_9STRA